MLKAFRAGDPAAIERFQAVIRRLADSVLTEADGGRSEDVALADAQFVLARQYGFESWAKLVHQVEATNPPGLRRFEGLAEEVAAAYTSGDYEAIREINWVYGTAFGHDRDLTRMQERLPTWFASEARAMDLALADARHLVARQAGFESWSGLVHSLTQSATPSGPAASVRGAPDAPPLFYRINQEQNTIEVRGPLSDQHWDTVVGVMKEMKITGLVAGGITDSALERLSRLDQLTRLLIGGSGLLTDDGVRRLTRLSQLRELDIGSPKSIITDRGLEVLRHLRELRRFQMSWAQQISDVGVANLRFCDHLESVDLMGTPTGDGAIAALAGKPNLRRFKTGRMVTDAGLPLLHQFPIFNTWHGGDVEYSLLSAEAAPNHLMLDGPFTNRGVAALAGLEGVFGLSFFWHLGPGFTPDGLAPLAALPHLGMLGCEGKLCNDEAMRHIGGLPKLRMLMAQGTVASDAGFAALSRSRTIEHIWGRECPNLTGRGFAALATMPALRGLAVSCKRVDDEALSLLPHFPALREFMPMDVPDAGFRHVGRCAELEALTCMYCRDTTDIATGHIAGLTKLRKYYAGRTRITDASLQILGRMDSLERLEFWEVFGITDAGVAELVGLPRLRELSIEGSPKVTRAVMGMFPAGVRVSYSG